jgi:hypothetical protein
MDEYLLDLKAPCGCYEMGDWCYDKDGNPTHLADEECNQ